MIDSTLFHRLSPVARRVQIRRSLMLLAALWSVAGLAGLALWWLKLSVGWYSLVGLIALLVLTALTTIVALWFGLRDDPDFRRTVRKIEGRYPELDSALVTAVEQRQVRSSAPLGYLQTEVVRRAVYHGYQHAWDRVVPRWHLLLAGVLVAGSLVLLVASIGGQLFSAAAGIDPGRAMSAVTGMFDGAGDDFVIEPGDVEIERGTSLLVLARFGSANVPGRAELVFLNESGGQQILEMPRSLQDPVFAARIPQVGEPIQYHVQFDESRSRTYKVTVFDFPHLERADATIHPPESTGGEARTIEDVRRVSAMQTSRLELVMRVNKPLAAARLVADDGRRMELVGDDSDPLLWRFDMTLVQSERLELKLVDREERENKTPPVFLINVLDNQRPKIEIENPAGDIEVSPLEEIDIAANAWDDAGIRRAGLTWTANDGQSREITLLESVASGTKHPMTHQLALEELAAQPDDLLTFYLWAEDAGPDGSPRRTNGDLVFVEVRPFEEIFRQGEAPPDGANPAGGQQGGGGGAGQADQLAELQKQVINATWNLIRRDQTAESDSAFAEDVQTVSRSQAAILRQLETLLEEVSDEAMRQTGGAAAVPMKATIEHLESARRRQDAEPLQQAVTTAQLAFAMLLRLRQREHEVVRNRQQPSGGGQPNSRSQRQLEQLQLENDENRYQTEQQARDATEAEESREDRQILSRLRELARRQNDLNQRMRELQSALEAAETDEEQRDLTDQLKRLQDEQEQILRDAEELQQRLSEPDNQSRMSDEARQLDEARENIQQSGESLQKGEVSTAAAEGTRAQRQLRDLRDEFQQRASGQFDDQIQQLRNEVRDVQAEQQGITSELEDQSDEAVPHKSLSGAGRDDLSRRLERQRDRVRSLDEEMRELVVESEEVEPIMAERLYDTWREAQQEPPAELLNWAAEALQRGFLEDAREQNEQAGAAIDRLREGIDRAAEAVLGDETDALRRASQELQQLAGELNQESRRGRGEPGDAKDEERDSETVESAPAPASDESTTGDNQASPPRDEDSEPGDRGTQPASGGDEDSGSNGERNIAGPPSLDGRDREDPRGGYGADPQLNYDQASDSLQPIAGDDWMDWSDRLRDVEEMVADPDLRSEATRIREEARTIRGEVRRHSRPPNWDLVELKLIRPLIELQDRVHEELLRRGDNKLLVPLDRDPVPPEFEEGVRQYYEQLGRGQ